MDSFDIHGLPTAVDIDRAFQEYFGEEDEDDKRHEPVLGKYHSSDSGKCLRWRFYKDTIGSDFPEGIAERGNRIEDFVFEVLDMYFPGKAKNDHPVKYEEDGIKITGSTDPYVELRGDVWMVTEVKSTDNIPATPKFHHAAQLNTYLSVLGVPRGFVIYVSPTKYTIQVFQHEQDATMWEYTKTLHRMYHDYWADDDLPPRMPQYEGECRWCDFKGLCVRNEKGVEYR